ncbi:hypothetical protein EX895_000997 [Sporisorium graminicola]|uniref:Protein kinase domain-containing protein n=1 Tax=Sporisorium graminicola TaxID=280036 RepID=A0A4U7L4T8_9BASI|nr:hypothetical protein EX895_000997 [Sporisorium graminicola]TKY90998.1 hypothetical protein EX895_000997 [Sporisorium graminicola]
MAERDDGDATQSVIAQNGGDEDVSREVALRQRLAEARKEKRGEHDEPEAKRQRVEEKRDTFGNDGEDSAPTAGERQAEQPQPQRSATWRPARTWSGLQRSAHPAISASRSIYAYERLNHIQEGTYGVVFRARPRDPPPAPSTSTSPSPSVSRQPEVVAVKKLKLGKNGLDSHGFPITSLREIQTLSLAKTHSNVVRLHEVCVGKTLDQIFLVMEFVEHDLKSLLMYKHRAKTGFAPSEVKTLMHQLLSAVAALHRNWIVHRDLKSSNLLMNNRGQLKVADFGLARRFGDPVDAWLAKSRPRTLEGDAGGESKTDSKVNGQEVEAGMTDLVVTLWYRAPEVLLLNHIHRAREVWRTNSSKPTKSLAASSLFRQHSQPYPHPRPPLPLYDEKIDMWSVGCIFAELLLTATTGAGLFQGSDEADQLRKIDAVLGGYNTTNWPDVLLWMGLPHRHHATPAVSPAETQREAELRKRRLQTALHPAKLTRGALDLLFQLLQYDPHQRISAEQALEHEYFTGEPPRMAHPDSFGSFPSVAAGESVAMRETPSAPNARAAANAGVANSSKTYAMEFDFAAT